MMKLQAVACCVAMITIGASSSGWAQDTSHITTAPGFQVSVAAGSSLVKHPLMAGFDDRGRLYIAESAGENLRRDDLEKQLPNFIRRLEDVDHDGVFDRSTIFADKLTLPQGALWHQGSLYVAAPPNIWKFTDHDDDGVADTREIIVDQFGYTGNAASIHGCFLGPTGRLYWCDGRHGHSVEDAQGNLISEGKAARIFSCRLDGTDLQVHCGGGMDNPVEIDFSPTGEMLGTVNLFYRQRGDCLVHWMHGGVYPRYDQTCVDEFRRTGDLLKEVHNFGHVAVSGMTRLRAPWNLAAFHDPATKQAEPDATHWVVTEFNSHKVMHAEVRRRGSSFSANVTELLRSSSDDFHPTDVLEDADGSLLVIDTGGWFRIGCPTSQIAKPNLLGAIYRVRPKNASPPSDPRGLKLSWDVPVPGLVGRLQDTRPAVVERATSRLSLGGEPAGETLAAWKPESTEQQLRRVWALARNNSTVSRRALAALLANDAEAAGPIVLAAATACGQLKLKSAVPLLVRHLEVGPPEIRREAATALGRIGDPTAAQSLLSALAHPKNDRVLEHAIIFALMELKNVAALRSALEAQKPVVQRGALLALDQTAPDKLKQDDVLRLVGSDDLTLQAAALDVMAKRPEWGAAAIGQLERLVASPRWDAATRGSVKRLVIALQHDQRLIPVLAAGLLNREGGDVAMLLQVIAIQGEAPAAWDEGILRGIRSPDSEVVSAAIAAANSHRRPAFQNALEQLGNDQQRPASLRIAAWNAWVVVARQRFARSAFAFLIAQLMAEDTSPLTRLAAARALADSPTTLQQATVIAKLAKTVGPMELPPLINVWQQHADASLGQLLVNTIAASPAGDSVDLNSLESLFRNYPPEVREAAEPLIAARKAKVAERSELLDDYVADKDGNAVRGQHIFFSREVGCAACHRVAGKGGSVGPDLSTIGQRRSKRDLLEAVLFPSASQARGFESFLFRLHDGRQVSGLMLEEGPADLVVRTSDQRSIRMARDAIEAMKPSPLSVMPAGLEKTMNETQLQDLIMYLQSLKAP